MNQIDNIDMTTTDERIEADGQLILDGMPEPIEETESALTIEEIVEQIASAMGWSNDQSETLYRLHVLVNGVLNVIGAQKDGKDYRVTSQMMYTYARNGIVVKKRKSSEKVTGTQAREFTTRFAAKFVK